MQSDADDLRDRPDTAQSWVRLAISLLLATIGGVGMWSVVVVLPAVEAEFGASRAEATLPYTLTMVGFAIGGVMMGGIADRVGVTVSTILGALALAVGYYAASFAGSLWQFALIQGVLIGFLGASATFAPLVADVSHWFERRRGIAVSICASGNYLAGALWPPVLQYFIDGVGWRATHTGVGIFCVVTMVPLALLLRRRPPKTRPDLEATAGAPVPRMSPGVMQALLIVAGLACCVAMSMPQVHIVAYCGNLGYGAARGTEMLSIMLGLGVVSRVACGFIADRIGGLRTLLLGSALQGVALLLYFFFEGLSALYIISALFGLFQGGIVPSYAVVVREYFPASEAGARVGAVIMATVFGMALGGWLSGAIFDMTGSYQAAFANGFLWNMLNLIVVLWMLSRTGTRGRPAAEPPVSAVPDRA